IAAARDVVVYIQRVDLAAIFEHDAFLCRALAAVSRQIGPGRQLGDGPTAPCGEPARTNVLAYNLGSGRRGHVAVQRGAAVGANDLNHRLAMALAVAANRLDDAVRARLPRRLLQGRAHRLAAAGDPAGTEPDPDFDGRAFHAV